MIRIKKDEKDTFYLTTAIPYVNAAPHIGHVLEFVQTDVIARYQRSRGKEVAITTGADENSLKNVQAAEAKGTTPAQLCETNAALFRKIADSIGLSYTSFIRSSIPEEHWAGPQKLWNLCLKAGDIYKKKYRGLYCVGCESFYDESELPDGICPEHKSKPEVVEEENYFFRLSKYQKKLEQLIDSNDLAVIPASRKNEILQFIRGGLNDFSISRSVSRARGWGVPVPGDETQIQYVWFDALSVYVTGVGYGKNEKQFKKFWPADVHVIGKGILRFHAVYWPAILLSAGVLPPKSILVHGYITVEGQKMSKTLGNIIDPFHLIEKYGVDPLRYCLLSEISTFDDGDFSEKVLVEKNNNELLANIGNLVNRTLVFTKNNFDSSVPELNPDNADYEFLKNQNALIAGITAGLECFRLTGALHEILSFSASANKYFQDNAPWKLVKEGEQGKARCGAVISVLLHQVKDLAILLEPYLPQTSAAIFKQLGFEPRKWDDLGKLSLASGTKLGIPTILFKKIEQKEIEDLQKKYSGTQQSAIGSQQPAVSFSDFDIEVGEILEVKKHPNAEKLYIEKVQLGDGVRQLVSGLAKYYLPEQLLHKRILVVRNLKSAVLRGEKSEGMLLAAENKEGMVEVVSPKKSHIGDKVFLSGGSQNQTNQTQSKPRAEIDIDDFFKVKILVENQKVMVSEGKKKKQLATKSESICTENVIEGKVS